MKEGEAMRPVAELLGKHAISSATYYACKAKYGGGRLRLIALIEETAVIDRILRHLGLPTALPAARPARAPPLLALAGEAQTDES